MLKPRNIGSLTAAAAFFFAALLGGETSARADDTVKHPGDHPNYNLELEPHANLALTDFYGTGYNGGTGFGLGGRFTIPIVQNGFIPTINNNVGITFGLDFVHYSCSYNFPGRNSYDCSANFLFFPVAMQWNFFVAERWSVGAEPGLFVYHGIYDDPCDGLGINCAAPSRTSIRPAFYAVGRYHFNEKVSLTMRLGYPTFSVGVSFFM